jgi:type IV secretory pathway VirB2 component (pilin)
LGFFVAIILIIALGVDAATNRNEYKEYIQGVKAAGA